MGGKKVDLLDDVFGVGFFLLDIPGGSHHSSAASSSFAVDEDTFVLGRGWVGGWMGGWVDG